MSRQLVLIFDVDDQSASTEILYELGDRIVTQVDPDPPILTFAECQIRGAADRDAAEMTPAALAHALDDQRFGTEPAAVVDVPMRTVTIPASAEHDGWAKREVTVPWVCPQCGKPRGEPTWGISYDGSRQLSVHTWTNNICGHVDSYAAVRAEADTLEGAK